MNLLKAHEKHNLQKPESKICDTIDTLPISTAQENIVKQIIASILVENAGKNVINQQKKYGIEDSRD